MVHGKQTVLKPAKTNFIIIFTSGWIRLPNDGIVAVTIGLNDADIFQVSLHLSAKFLEVHTGNHVTWSDQRYKKRFLRILFFKKRVFNFLNFLEHFLFSSNEIISSN